MVPAEALSKRHVQLVERDEMHYACSCSCCPSDFCTVPGLWGWSGAHGPPADHPAAPFSLSQRSTCELSQRALPGACARRVLPARHGIGREGPGGAAHGAEPRCLPSSKTSTSRNALACPRPCRLRRSISVTSHLCTNGSELSKTIENTRKSDEKRI